MRRACLLLSLAVLVLAQSFTAWAEPVFVNGIVIPGARRWTPPGSRVPTPGGWASSPTSTTTPTVTSGGRSRIGGPAGACSTTPRGCNASSWTCIR
jgi:hypothetical protein